MRNGLVIADSGPIFSYYSNDLLNAILTSKGEDRISVQT
jgi:hypothetical protein